ncbi:hypothetical protein F2P56_014767 [Juglans regia]|uniref:Uncharacterized protein LOC108984916 n=2 Tax=Juglans regia TaxID=51240 RepID=A0A2I4DZI1_JUGRE|nr:uncharacterized protein LOC108984916 [Juglans regia]KAF5464713.1 hypothetical protein F2P56_014767 [Juglans regia]
MVCISEKLKKLKRVLQIWNREEFSRVEEKLKKVEDRISELDTRLAQPYSTQLENEWLNCQQDHSQWVHREETLACQKSRTKWLVEGDDNIGFFHASIRFRKQSKRIVKMRLDDGRTLDTGEAVHEEAVVFFQRLLSVAPIASNLDEMELVQPVVSMEENEALCTAPTLEEIKRSLWSMMAWDIVKEDLLEMVEDFFAGQPLSTFFGATNLVLIPKVDEPLGFGQFSPISLYSVVYKIMSKIMVFRLALLLEKIISPEQASFISGRSIF